MKIQLQLTIFIVCFGLVFVYPPAKNRYQSWKKTLQTGVLESQNIFNNMKDELQRAQNTNIRRKISFNAKWVKKRETNNPASIGVRDASRELPGEHDRFEDLRANNKKYVDKTGYISKLLTQGSRFISICRPRQFGKSNFLQMLKSFFMANQTLFEGLHIYPQHNWQSQPVIYLDFSKMEIQTVEDFKTDLARKLREIGQSYGYLLNKTESPMTLLDELMYELSNHAENFESIVVLIDEYDWPVRQNAGHNNIESWEVTHFLIEFFQEIKTFGDKIKMLILTCTTPLQLRNFKGGLDFVKDITYDDEYSGMLGLTETELRSNFKSYIEKMVLRPQETFDSIVQDLKKHYNGYCFSKNTKNACRVFNFHSVISAVRNKNITDYWHPNFDPKYNTMNAYQTEEHQRNVGTLSSYTNYTISRHALQAGMDVINPNSIIVCMVVYGYLTFRDYKEDTDVFILDFPNEEVRHRFIKEVLQPIPLGALPVNEVLDKCETLRQTMFGDAEKCEQFVDNLNEMAFATEASEEDTTVNVEDQLDVDLEKGAQKSTKPDYKYAGHLVRVFQICDVENRYSYYFSKDSSPACRIDLVAEGANSTEQYVFAFEPIEDAMKKFLNFTKIPEFWETFPDRRIYLMGIVFSEDGGTIREWIRVTCENESFSDLRTSNPKYLKMYEHINGTRIITTGGRFRFKK